MKKDILIIKFPIYFDIVEINLIYKQIEDKLSEYYTIISYYENVNEVKVELLKPTLWNYIKYKFRNILNYGT